MMLHVTVACLQSAHRPAQTLLASLPAPINPPTPPTPTAAHHCPMAALRVMHHLLRAAACADPHERCAEAAAAAAAAAAATAEEARAPLFRCAAVAAAVAHDRRVDPASVLTELAAGELRDTLASLHLHVRGGAPRPPPPRLAFGEYALLLTSQPRPCLLYTHSRAQCRWRRRGLSWRNDGGRRRRRCCCPWPVGSTVLCGRRPLRCWLCVMPPQPRRYCLCARALFCPSSRRRVDARPLGMRRAASQQDNASRRWRRLHWWTRETQRHDGKTRHTC
jgi:hypothetical protein